LVNGSILRSTSEYLTLAFTHAAKGAVALETFIILDYSKLIGADSMIFSTFFLIPGVTAIASKFKMLEMTPC